MAAPTQANVWDAVPMLKHFYLPYERNWDVEASPFMAFAEKHTVLPIVMAALYVAAAFGGQHLMRDRAPFKLETALTAWNLALCLFSTVGAVRTVPHLLMMLWSMPFRSTVCLPASSSYGTSASGLWVMLFIYSKLPELVDTAFIVLRKRQLSLLHWYHHASVLVFCFASYSTRAPNGLYFTAMNYSVHSIMYGYYACKSLRVPTPVPAFAITAMQIVQMVIGFAIVLATAYYRLVAPVGDQSVVPCTATLGYLACGLVIYGSYGALFMQFALQRYTQPAEPPRQKRRKTVSPSPESSESSAPTKKVD